MCVPGIRKAFAFELVAEAGLSAGRYDYRFTVTEAVRVNPDCCILHKKGTLSRRSQLRGSNNNAWNVLVHR